MSFNFVTGLKKVTKVMAAGATLAVGWAVSDSGQQVIGGIVHAYPKLSGLVAIVSALALLLHSPKS